jgi:hypothetical protein
MVEIMHDDNTNALNVAILPISNGIAPFTSVEHVEKWHQDTHHELVVDASMMMVSAAITTLMDTKMKILTENAKSPLLVCIYLFSNRSKSRTTFSLPFFISSFHQTNHYYVSSSYLIFKPRCWSLNQQTLPTCHLSQTLDFVSQEH